MRVDINLYPDDPEAQEALARLLRLVAAENGGKDTSQQELGRAVAEIIGDTSDLEGAMHRLGWQLRIQTLCAIVYLQQLGDWFKRETGQETDDQNAMRAFETGISNLLAEWAADERAEDE